MMEVSLGYSPCPNDTFIFYGLVHGRIPGAPVCKEILEDIDRLNTMALEGRLDMVKVSFHALAYLLEEYCLLHAGGALGRGCGPLVVAGEGLEAGDLAKKKIAIPGKLTTAALLLRLFAPQAHRLEVMPFDHIMPAILNGQVDAGLIIHESRFTYPQYGLHKVVDLGEWWEESTGHPIPLGGIMARRAMGREQIEALDRGLRASVEFAYAQPESVKDYIRQHAQEMEDEVMQAHIDLYVNEYSLDYGVAGQAAIAALLERACREGIVPDSGRPLFVE
jgi:1,4-dihydroxy-6-naphthoate synthase